MELTFLQDRDVALMSLHERLGRAPFPLSKPFPRMERKVSLGFGDAEATYEMGYDTRHDCDSIKFGELKELRKWVSTSGGHSQRFIDVNIYQSRESERSDLHDEWVRLVKKSKECDLWFLTLDNDEEIIAVAPKKYHPENFTSYCKLRQANERADFSSGEISELRRKTQTAEVEFENDGDDDGLWALHMVTDWG